MTQNPNPTPLNPNPNPDTRNLENPNPNPNIQNPQPLNPEPIRLSLNQSPKPSKHRPPASFEDRAVLQDFEPSGRWLLRFRDLGFRI